MDKKVRKIQAKIRKMTWHQKLILMDWINDWYQGYKEEQEMLQRMWLEEE